MHKARSRELLPYGITGEEAAVMFVMQAIGYKATPAEISRWLLRERNSTSTLIERMEKKGLVKRIKDLERKNQIRVELTNKGHKVFNQSSKRESVHKIVSCLSNEERQQLMSHLKKLADSAMKEAGIKHVIPSYFIFPRPKGKILERL